MMPSTRSLTAAGRAPLVLFVGLLLAAATAVCAQSSDDSLAIVGGAPITEAEVLEAAGQQLDGVDAQLAQCQVDARRNRYRVMQTTVDRMVRERLAEIEAGVAGKDRDEWLDETVSARSAALTEAEVATFFEENRSRIRQGATLDQVANELRNYMAAEALFEELEDKHEVEVHLSELRFEVEATGPSKGADDAPVTIVEFSDFQCPYCKQVTPTLEATMDKYEGQVKLVFRHFPLVSIHPQAYKAAEASLCAADQGKFWELHDLMFEEQSTLEVSELEDKARRIGLEVEPFQQCLSSGKYTETVRQDLLAGAAAGVSGTPAFFVNGRFLNGAVSVEQLSALIDEELEAAGDS